MELKRTLSGFKTVQRTLSGFKTTMRRKPKAAAEAPAAAEPAPEQPEKQIKLEQAAPPTPRTGTRFFRALSFSKKGKKESARALTSSDPVAASAPVTAPPTTSERSAPRSPMPDRTAVSDELPPEPAPEVEDELFEMTVPEGVMPGDMLQATTPSGVTVRLEVPEGAEPGTILTFTLPAAEAQPRRQSRLSRQSRPMHQSRLSRQPRLSHQSRLSCQSRLCHLRQRPRPRPSRLPR